MSLPAATKLWPRLCFYTCLWFCPQGASPENPPDQAEPPWQGEPPPDQADTKAGRTPPPGPRRTPPGPGRQPPPSRENPHPTSPPPGRRLQHTVNERPVRILLECILVKSVTKNVLHQTDTHWPSLDRMQGDVGCMLIELCLQPLPMRL